MRDECKDAVKQVIGRSLTSTEVQQIENRVNSTLRKLAQEQGGVWQGKSKHDRLREASERVAQDLNAEASNRKDILAKDLVKIQNNLEDMQNSELSPLEWINHKLALKTTGDANFTSIDSEAKAIRNTAKAQLIDHMDRLGGRWLGLKSDAEFTKNFIREAHGQNTGDADAKKLADIWLEVTTQLRERFNRSGGMIGELDNWGTPHHHSVELLAKAGKNGKWVDDTLPLLDRSKYVNEDGTRMSDVEVTELLEDSYRTLVTNGANKVNANSGFFGNGAKTIKKHNHERVLHFADGDAWIAYQNKYGDRDTLNVLLGHVDAMSRDIALVENLGSDPTTAFKQLQAMAEKIERLQGASDNKVSNKIKFNKKLFTEVAGQVEYVSTNMSNWFGAYRSLNIASKLGGTTIASFSDEAMIAQAAHLHGISYKKTFGKEMSLLNPKNKADREAARELGLGIDEMVSAMNRFNDDGIATTATIAGKANKYSQAAASAVMRASGLNAMTAARKQAFGFMLMNKYGELARDKSWADLKHGDKDLLTQSGITEVDWKILKLANPQAAKNGGIPLSATDIMGVPDNKVGDIIGTYSKNSITRFKERLATRYMAHIFDWQGTGVIEAGSRERAQMYNGVRGTAGSEMRRSMLQFKSFTAAFYNRHMVRIANQDTKMDIAKQAMFLGVGMTLLGGASIQLLSLMQGEDPQEMLNSENLPKGKFWAAAALKGGGLGIFGDLLKAGTTPDGKGATELIFGPIGGDITKLSSMPWKATRDTKNGDYSSTGTAVAKFVKSHIPGQNLFYTRAAVDRLLFNELLDSINPNYLQRHQRRMEKKYDKSYWWDLDEALPSDIPDFARALGE